MLLWCIINMNTNRIKCYFEFSLLATEMTPYLYFPSVLSHFTTVRLTSEKVCFFSAWVYNLFSVYCVNLFFLISPSILWCRICWLRLSTNVTDHFSSWDLALGIFTIVHLICWLINKTLISFFFLFSLQRMLMYVSVCSLCKKLYALQSEMLSAVVISKLTSYTVTVNLVPTEGSIFVS